MSFFNSKPDMTICARCKYFLKEGEIWYDQYCNNPSVQNKETIDPVTGKMRYDSSSDRSQPYARDINHGDCKYYKKSP